VAPSTAYTFTVRAIDDAGNLGDAAAPVSVTTPAEAAPQPVPAPTPQPEPQPQPTPQPQPVPEPIPAPAPAVPAVAPSASAVVGAPAAPRRLRAATTKRTVTLTWSRSPDYRRVRLYQVFRDGVLRRSASVLAFRENRFRGRHVYTVRALATDGRRSAPARVVVGR
jgi:outer membrane biosynthesis protein TonB